MGDDRAGRLLRLKLKLLAELNIDAAGLHERPELGLVLQVRTRRIAEAVPAALIALLKQPSHLSGVLFRDAEFHPDLLVHVLGKGLGRLHAEAVQVQVVPEEILLEPLPRDSLALRPTVTM